MPCKQPGALQQGKEVLGGFALPRCPWKSPRSGERGHGEAMPVGSHASQGLPRAARCIDRLRGVSACQAAALLALAEAHRSPRARPWHWVCRENMHRGTCGSRGSKRGHRRQTWGQAHRSSHGGCLGDAQGNGKEGQTEQKINSFQPSVTLRHAHGPLLWAHGNTSSVVRLEHPPRDQPWAVHATWQHGANPWGRSQACVLAREKLRSHQRGAGGAEVLTQPQPAPASLSPSTGQG